MDKDDFYLLEGIFLHNPEAKDINVDIHNNVVDDANYRIGKMQTSLLNPARQTIYNTAARSSKKIGGVSLSKGITSRFID